jgi:hypothetical protein
MTFPLAMSSMYPVACTEPFVSLVPWPGGRARLPVSSCTQTLRPAGRIMATLTGKLVSGWVVCFHLPFKSGGACLLFPSFIPYLRPVSPTVYRISSRKIPAPASSYRYRSCSSATRHPQADRILPRPQEAPSPHSRLRIRTPPTTHHLRHHCPSSVNPWGREEPPAQRARDPGHRCQDPTHLYGGSNFLPLRALRQAHRSPRPGPRVMVPPPSTSSPPASVGLLAIRRNPRRD